MIREIFNELFGDNFDEMVKEVFQKYDNKDTEKEEDNENDTRSYFHSISDKYDNGKHVYHKEKEIKDGKVLKDVNETYQIEDKKKKYLCDKKEYQGGKGVGNDFYEKKIKEATDLLEQAQETIKNQQEAIEKLECENREFRTKFNALKDLFK